MDPTVTFVWMPAGNISREPEEWSTPQSSLFLKETFLSQKQLVHIFRSQNTSTAFLLTFVFSLYFIFLTTLCDIQNQVY